MPQVAYWEIAVPESRRPFISDYRPESRSDTEPASTSDAGGSTQTTRGACNGAHRQLTHSVARNPGRGHA